MTHQARKVLLALAGVAFAADAMAATWKIDPSHSSVEFSVRHMMISNIKGSFKKFEGELQFDPEKLKEGSVKVDIETSSVDTAQEKRDAHLKSKDFLDVETYPKMTFTSKSVEPTGEKTFKVNGTLELHGKSQDVVLEAENLGIGASPFGDTRAGFTASTTINRKDFGVDWNKVLDSGGVLVGDELKIRLEVEAIRQDPAAAEPKK